jgi:6,7-dimethyl-8-ribityllumazine synthase
MITKIQISRLVRNSADYERLVDLLETLGLRRSGGREDEHIRSVEFSSPPAGIEIVEPKTRVKQPVEADIWVHLEDPDTAFEVLQRRGFELLEDGGRTGARHAVVQLPSGTRVALLGATGNLEGIHLAWCDYSEGSLDGKGKTFGIVVSRFNSFITERLLRSSIDGLLRTGVKRPDIHVVWVPGSFEIPGAARTLAETRKYDAIICIGCLLRGDTLHYEVIANEVVRGIGQSSQETGVPHALGVLTCDTLEQAIDRAGLKSGNKGFEAALAAVEMASLKKSVGTQYSALRRAKQISRDDDLRSTPRGKRRQQSRRGRT